MSNHKLNTWPTYWDAMESGDKTFEVRRNDRGFQKGDTIELIRLLRDESTAPYATGYEPLRFRITYVLQGGQFGIDAGFCVLGLSKEPTP